MDDEIFKAIAASKSDVPVVLIVTKKDKLWNIARSEALGEDDEEEEEDDDDISARFKRNAAKKAADEAVEHRGKQFLDEFTKRTRVPFIGPILTSKSKLACFVPA